jgi:hypothetical protein
MEWQAFERLRPSHQPIGNCVRGILEPETTIGIAIQAVLMDQPTDMFDVRIAHVKGRDEARFSALDAQGIGRFFEKSRREAQQYRIHRCFEMPSTGAAGRQHIDMSMQLESMCFTTIQSTAHTRCRSGMHVEDVKVIGGILRVACRHF